MCLIFNGYVVTFKHNTIEEYEGVERKKFGAICKTMNTNKL